MTPMPISVTTRSSPLRRIEVRHDADERVVRLADGFLNGADRLSADGAGGSHLPALDRPRLLQRALGRYYSGADTCRATTVFEQWKFEPALFG